MIGDMLPEKIEKLESVFLNILYLKPEERLIAPNMSILGDLRSILNKIFDENTCTDVLYTLNTDKPFFGIRINPGMSSNDAVVILSTDEKVKLNNYKIELDSKLFDIGLNEEELASLIVYEISSMMDSYEIFDQVRTCVDATIVSMDDIVNIRDSVNYSQLIIFAIKDTMYKLSSYLFADSAEELTINPVISACDLEDSIRSAYNKVSSSMYGSSESMRASTTSILKWMFVMYKNMRTNSDIIKDTLLDAKTFTASRLDIDEINKTINSVDRIDSTILIGEGVSLDKFFDAKHLSSLNEFSLFRSLKKNGLRGIEDELYEYTMRVKNCTESEDAFLIMRGINNRLSILEDYLDTEDIKDSERRHWTMVADKYRELRYALSKKKFKEKQYGLFFDYNQLPSDNDQK